MIKLVLSAVALTAIVLGGCGSSRDFVKPDQAQIDAYIQAHPDLPELDKACILDGRFEIGMRRETVRFLLGEPKKIEQIKQPWALQEKWYYKKGNVKVFFMEGDGVVGIEEN
ncbi:MAG: hypothetical protein GF344_12190 [Chitinivibrionales bacterium]|nr:hypothetical protein [Chitinivibrionales bacterium]MBD3357530.1 hypothetical protein [Chitinivibrionales bacterium]